MNNDSNDKNQLLKAFQETLDLIDGVKQKQKIKIKEFFKKCEEEKIQEIRKRLLEN